MKIGEKPIEAVLSRSHLEKLCKPLFREMRDALDRCCWQAGVDLVSLHDSLKDTNEQLEIRPKKRPPVSEILLVGAATKMPVLRTFLRNMTSLKVRETVDPETCVALGAALEAGRLSGEVPEDFMMMDVWQASLLRAFAKDQISNQ